MTASAWEQEGPRDERRRGSGIALISHRQMALASRLWGTSVAYRHISPPSARACHVLEGVRPPLLLDTVGMPPAELVDLLCEVSHRWRPLPTIVLLRPDNTLALRLAAVCPAVPVLLSETVHDQVFCAWLRQATQIATRPSPAIPPALVALQAPSRPIPLSLPLLHILRALQPAYQPLPGTMHSAAAGSAFSRRMFFYHLAALRAVLQIDPARRYRPEDLAAIIYARLGA